MSVFDVNAMMLTQAPRLFTTLSLCCVLVAVPFAQTYADDSLNFEFSGNLKFETRWFPKSAAYPRQARQASGIVFEPNIYIENERGWSFSVSPFFRYDNVDSERAHADIREAYLLMFGDAGDNEWEFRLGVDHVFWGVAEVINLVDIVNQTDLIEDPDGKTKLGQLMAHLTLSGDWGVGELFVLPDHRSRTYPGINGRLRSALVVDSSLATYEHKSGDNHIDFAARYSNSIGPADIGFSVFDGTSREPSIRPSTSPVSLIPHYEQIRQYGFDAAITVSDFLVKLEAIRRTDASNLSRMKDDFSAYIVGAEYPFYSVFDSDTDVVLLGEWIYDDRGKQSTNPLQNEIFLAAHINLNDINGTEFSISFLQDRDFNSNTMTFEFRRRINDEWSVELKAVDFLNTDPNDVNQHPIRRDDFVNLSLAYNF